MIHQRRNILLNVGRSAVSLAAVITGLCASVPLMAAVGETQNVLEEVLVTARKKEESLQKVPQSVSALSEREIQNTNARDLRDLVGMAPNLVIERINAGPGVAGISLRGISHNDVEKSFDPAVGVVLDGIFLGTNTGQELQAFDLERVEVLRGPQGTLFGRNSIGGIINVVRSKPSGEFGGKVRGSVGDYERTEIEGLVNFPIIANTLAAKATLTQRKQDEGFFENTVNDDEVPKTDYSSYLMDVLYTPNDNLSVRYIYQREDDDSDTPVNLNVSQPADLLCLLAAQCAQDERTTQQGNPFEIAHNFSNSQFLELDAHTLELNWDISDTLRLTYLYGLRDSEEQTDQDFDASAVAFYETRRMQDYKQQSHEFRLNGKFSDVIDYVAGIYSWDSEYQKNQTNFLGFNTYLGLPAGVSTDIADHQNDATSVFFESNIALDSQWTLTVGGRYTDEEKELSIREYQGDGSSGDVFNTIANPAKDDWTEFSPKTSIAYQATDEMMVYATYSKGFRSGGLNGRATTAVGALLSYDPETVDSVELGMKSTWLEKKLQFNAALFTQKYKDKQEEIVIPSAASITGFETVTLNAAEATIQGAEIEVRFLPVDGWFIAFNVGLLDAEYDDFSDADNLTGLPEDISDLELRRTPDYSYSLTSNYERQMGLGLASIQGAWRYRDDSHTSFLNEEFGLSRAHGVLDASVAYTLEHWRFTVYGRNLKDEDEPSAGLTAGGLFSIQGVMDPRTWGADVVYSW